MDLHIIVQVLTTEINRLYVYSVIFENIQTFKHHSTQVQGLAWQNRHIFSQTKVPESRMSDLS
jgi:hypothetical protein